MKGDGDERWSEILALCHFYDQLLLVMEIFNLNLLKVDIIFIMGSLKNKR